MANTKHERFHYQTAAELKAALEAFGLNLPFSEDLTVLGEPFTLGETTLKNRLGIQPMEGCDGTRAGAPDELTFRRYERFAKGGAAVLWMEAMAVCPEGRANPRQLYLSAENLDAFTRLNAMIAEPVSYTHLDVYKRQVYHWDDRISGVSNICPDKSGLDVKIKSEAIIDYAKYGTIEIKKVVENADGSTSSDKNTSFYFRITSADGRFSETFTLKNGESKKYQSLPVGTYYVDELNVPSGYTVEGYNREVVLKEANEYKTLTVTNVKKDTQKGTLTVGKILEENKDAVNLPEDASFTFTVTGNGVNTSFTLTKADILLGKDSYTFANLTPGSYTVTETAAYTNGSMVKTTTASVKVGNGQETNVDLENDGLTASVRKGEATSVWFTNAYDAKPQTFPVIVNYYKDSISSANYLGTTSLGEYEANTPIILSAEPVSYTHLDVYKRQILTRA